MKFCHRRKRRKTQANYKSKYSSKRLNWWYGSREGKWKLFWDTFINQICLCHQNKENTEIRVHTICYTFIIMFISIPLLLYGHVTASGKARVLMHVIWLQSALFLLLHTVFHSGLRSYTSYMLRKRPSIYST